MKDKRGIDRGKCTNQGCPCTDYLPQRSGSQACGGCNHPPAKHVPQGGIPVPGNESGGQSRQSQRGGQEASSFMSLPMCRSLSSLSSSEAKQSLEYTSEPVVKPQPLHSAPVQPVLDGRMRCQYPGCPKPKYVEDGRVHDFCGKTHANMYQGQGV